MVVTRFFDSFFKWVVAGFMVGLRVGICWNCGGFGVTVVVMWRYG